MRADTERLVTRATIDKARDLPPDSAARGELVLQEEKSESSVLKQHPNTEKKEKEKEKDSANAGNAESTR